MARKIALHAAHQGQIIEEKDGKGRVQEASDRRRRRQHVVGLANALHDRKRAVGEDNAAAGGFLTRSSVGDAQVRQFGRPCRQPPRDLHQGEQQIQEGAGVIEVELRGLAVHFQRAAASPRWAQDGATTARRAHGRVDDGGRIGQLQGPAGRQGPASDVGHAVPPRSKRELCQAGLDLGHHARAR